MIKELIDCRDIEENISDLCKWSPLITCLGLLLESLLRDSWYWMMWMVAKEIPHMADIFMNLKDNGWMFKKNLRIMEVFKQANAVPDNNFIN